MTKTHRVHILEANGESYRLKDTKNGQDEGTKKNENTAPRLASFHVELGQSVL